MIVGPHNDRLPLWRGPVELTRPRRISLTAWRHRCHFAAVGAVEQCIYCGATRRPARIRRDLALVALGLGFVAALGVLARL